MRPKQFPSLWYVRRKPCILRQRYHCLQLDRNELPLVPHHLGVPPVVSKTIFERMVRLVQTVHLSCTDNNTISKEKEGRFHMTQVA